MQRADAEREWQRKLEASEEQLSALRKKMEEGSEESAYAVRRALADAAFASKELEATKEQVAVMAETCGDDGAANLGLGCHPRATVRRRRGEGLSSAKQRNEQ